MDRLGAFALFLRSALDGNVLSFSKSLQPARLDRRDVNEHIAAAVVRFDETVAALSIEELDCPSHGHRETPPPYCSAATRMSRNDRPTFAAGCLATFSRPASRHRSAWIFLGLDHSAATIRGSGTESQSQHDEHN